MKNTANITHITTTGKEFTGNILPIYLHPHPMLREVATPVTAFDAPLHQHIADMKATMLNAHGVGLAATQVGIKQRLLVIDRRLGDEKKLHDDTAPTEWAVYINPEIIAASSRKTSHEMGCLSVPHMFTQISSADTVTLKFQDDNGAEHTEEIHGYYAAGVLHEIDHLNGILFPDHLSRLKREMFYKKYLKLLSAILREVQYPVMTAE